MIHLLDRFVPLFLSIKSISQIEISFHRFWIFFDSILIKFGRFGVFLFLESFVALSDILRTFFCADNEKVIINIDTTSTYFEITVFI